MRKAVLVTHGRSVQVGDAVERLATVAREAGVDLVVDAEEAGKHGLPEQGDPGEADLVLVLGGDGTMLRALQRFLGTGIPVLGVNFGRVGFLCAIEPDDLESGVARAFAGDLVRVQLPTLLVRTAAGEHVAVNDVVVTSAELGRMVELEWAVGGEDLGTVSCDGLICTTPSGSTAYNLSNGGPVLMWGLDAAAITFVAPHSLHARPLVVPRGRDVVVWNRTVDVAVAVLVDGHRVGDAGPGEQVTVGLAASHSLLGTLPGATFVARYRTTFAT
ncbi:MAG: NAD(+)/NADH kinase [Gaiella sp.]